MDAAGRMIWGEALEICTCMQTSETGDGGKQRGGHPVRGVCLKVFAYYRGKGGNCPWDEALSQVLATILSTDPTALSARLLIGKLGILA